MGYSWPTTDEFFHHLYAIGTIGQPFLRRVWVFNPDKTLEVRSKGMLGDEAASCFEYLPMNFDEALETIRKRHL